MNRDRWALNGPWWVLPVCAAVAALAPLPPSAVERIYARGWYAALQPGLTALSNAVALAWLDPLLPLAGVAVLAWCRHAWRRARGPGWRRILRTAVAVLQAAALVYLLFLALWGLNYRREPASVRFDVDPARLTAVALEQLAERTVAEVNGLYDPAPREGRLSDAALVTALAPAFQAAQRELGARWTALPGHPKRSIVARAFPLAGVDGMVNPFGLEVILNPEVLPFERPFVLAHEWGHLAGHAAESEASFVAWLTCLRGSRSIRYSGWLGLYVHLLRTLPPAARQRTAEDLAAGPQRDLAALRARLQRAQPAVHRISWEVYDRYLRANRVEGGVASYDQVIALVLGSRLAAEHVR